jgi:hypothetical protein
MNASHEDPSNQLLRSSITYRIAVGPQQGRKVYTLQTLPDCFSASPEASKVSEVAGFSLHAGVATRAAVKNLNGKDVAGNRIRVKEAQQKPGSNSGKKGKQRVDSPGKN